MSRLEATGTLERVANRGFRVRFPDVDELDEVVEMRRLLEGHAAYLASSRATPEVVAELFDAVAQFRNIAERARGGADPADLRSGWHRANSRFHDTIFRAAGNRSLQEAAERLHHRLPRNLTWSAMNGDARHLARNANEHEGIALAIELGDAERARELAIAHINNAQSVLHAAFDGPGPA